MFSELRMLREETQVYALIMYVYVLDTCHGLNLFCISRAPRAASVHTTCFTTESL